MVGRDGNSAAKWAPVPPFWILRECIPFVVASFKRVDAGSEVTDGQGTGGKVPGTQVALPTVALQAASPEDGEPDALVALLFTLQHTLEERLILTGLVVFVGGTLSQGDLLGALREEHLAMGALPLWEVACWDVDEGLFGQVVPLSQSEAPEGGLDVCVSIKGHLDVVNLVELGPAQR